MKCLGKYVIIFRTMLGNRGSRIASWLIGFLPTGRCNALKRLILRIIGSIEVGKGTVIYSSVRFNGCHIRIGRNCHIGARCEIIAPASEAWVTIGDWCSFGPEVFITTGGHDPAKGNDHRTNGIQLPITLGEHVGLGVRSMVMPGVTIGNNSIISPGVLVTRNIKPNMLVGPASPRMVCMEQ